MTVQEALDQLQETYQAQRDDLYNESTQLRHELERTTDPLLYWVYDLYTWLQEQDNRECASLVRDLQNLDGLYIEDGDGVTIEYNVENAMDDYTNAAMDAISEAIAQLQEALGADPLIRASDNPKTAPVVDALRTLAESLGGKR